MGRGLRRPVAAMVAGVALLAACSSGDEYTEDDVGPEVELTFPRATETRRNFTDEESGRSIHFDDLSSPARLERFLELGTRTPSVEIYEWYDEELTDLGWTSRLGLDGARNTNSVSYDRTEGSRTDVVTVVAGFLHSNMTEFSIRYTIDVERDDE